MTNNCMNCIYAVAVTDGATGRRRHRCFLDGELMVNKMMYCEEWCGTVPFDGTGRRPGRR